MTTHPARPAHPYLDPALHVDELEDIDTLTAAVFAPDVPLRDRVATLVADWQDTTKYRTVDSEEWGAAASRHVTRRGLA